MSKTFCELSFALTPNNKRYSNVISSFSREHERFIIISFFFKFWGLFLLFILFFGLMIPKSINYFHFLLRKNFFFKSLFHYKKLQFQNPDLYFHKSKMKEVSTKMSLEIRKKGSNNKWLGFILISVIHRWLNKLFIGDNNLFLFSYLINLWSVKT